MPRARFPFRLVASTVVLGLRASFAMGQAGLPYTIEPPDGSVRFGRTVASGGDVDGDGMPDIFIADPALTVDNQIVGQWFVRSGRDGGPIWSSVGVDPFVPDEWENIPIIVADFVSDLNGDQRDDLIIGIPDALNHRGVALLLSGQTGQVLHRFDGSITNGRLGREVRGLSDLTGDRIPDFAIITDVSRPGTVTVFSGATRQPVYSYETYNDTNPRRIREAGDLNGDQIPDLIISTSGGGFGAVIFGDLVALSGTTGQQLWIAKNQGAIGYSLAAGNDLNDDDVPDVVTTRSRPDELLAYSGSDGTFLAAIQMPVSHQFWGTALQWADINVDEHVELIALRVSEDTFGIDAINVRSQRVLHWAQGVRPSFAPDWPTGNEMAVADLNGDGADDFIIGSSGGAVRIIGGGELLVNFQERRADYIVGPGQTIQLTVGGPPPQTAVRLLASRSGSGCTFIARLGLCIDLNRPIFDLGSAVANPQRTAHFEVVLPDRLPTGPLWIQAIDPTPRNQATKSNVLQLEIRD